MTNASPSFGAIGPSHVDPRSGEILDADIGFESLSSRNVRALRSQVLVSRVAADWPALLQSSAPERVAELTARGAAGAGHAADRASTPTWPPSSWPTRWTCSRRAASSTRTAPRPQQFVLDYLTDMTMHEVGHTLGLRHNFRSSRVYTDSAAGRPRVHAQRTASPAR